MSNKPGNTPLGDALPKKRSSAGGANWGKFFVCERGERNARWVITDDCPLYVLIRELNAEPEADCLLSAVTTDALKRYGAARSTVVLLRRAVTGAAIGRDIAGGIINPRTHERSGKVEFDNTSNGSTAFLVPVKSLVDSRYESSA